MLLSEIVCTFRNDSTYKCLQQSITFRLTQPTWNINTKQESGRTYNSGKTHASKLSIKYWIFFACLECILFLSGISSCTDEAFSNTSGLLHNHGWEQLYLIERMITKLIWPGSLNHHCQFSFKNRYFKISSL